MRNGSFAKKVQEKRLFGWKVQWKKSFFAWTICTVLAENFVKHKKLFVSARIRKKLPFIKLNSPCRKYREKKFVLQNILRLVKSSGESIFTVSCCVRNINYFFILFFRLNFASENHYKTSSTGAFDTKDWNQTANITHFFNLMIFINVATFNLLYKWMITYCIQYSKSKLVLSRKWHTVCSHATFQQVRVTPQQY